MLHARLLHYLDETARTGSIRKAAERLNVVPSAISRQIMAYEDELGTPIFERLPRKLVLTAAGEIIIRHVRATLKEMERAQDQIEELKGLRRGEITVAVMSGLAANLVPRAIAQFQQRNQRVQVNMRLLSSGEEIIAAVTSGEAQLGIGFDFPAAPGVRVLDHVLGQLGAVMAPDHPLASHPSLRISECLGYRLIVADASMVIRPYLDQLFARSKIEPWFAIETNSIEVMRHTAMMDQGITFLTPIDIDFELHAGRLTWVPVRELAQHQQKLLLIGPEKNVGALVSVFVENLRQVMQGSRRQPA
ncbi:MAG: LysR substrate-binding domain-containing protein [Moraxellaceae bacterium]|nr:LysR substrate-binding domain-containing protein [Moraxellaceae bacterium]